MKLGVMTPVLYDMDLEQALEYLSSLGVQTVEIGAGGYPGKAHIDPVDYIGSTVKAEQTKKLLRKYHIEISAISCHGNPVHPNADIARKFHNDFIDALRVAQMLDVETIIGFSGCPGDCENSRLPNWVTCSWPSDFDEVLNYQWNQIVIPYWQEMADTAQRHGIQKIALEMHPGFCVYNPETLFKLRNAVSGIIGANFDPSHLIWQQIDPAEAIKYLGETIYHFHAKDTKIYSANCAINGVLDTKSYSDLPKRSWLFRTVGYGGDYKFWKDIFSALQIIGYEGSVSIEHEDALMSPKDGLEKAIKFLQETMIFDKATEEAWWV